MALKAAADDLDWAAGEFRNGTATPMRAQQARLAATRARQALESAGFKIGPRKS